MITNIITTGKIKILIVKVPTEYNKFRISNHGYAGIWLIESHSTYGDWKINFTAPKGYKYEFICTLNGMTPLLADEIVPKIFDDANNYEVYYKNYTAKIEDEEYSINNPVQSFVTLLESLNLSLVENYAIIKVV